MASMTNISILIVEDEAIVAENLANKVTKLGHNVIGTTANWWGNSRAYQQAAKALHQVIPEVKRKLLSDSISGADYGRFRHRF